MDTKQTKSQLEQAKTHGQIRDRYLDTGSHLVELAQELQKEKSNYDLVEHMVPVIKYLLYKTKSHQLINSDILDCIKEQGL